MEKLEETEVSNAYPMLWREKTHQIVLPIVGGEEDSLGLSWLG